MTKLTLGPAGGTGGNEFNDYVIPSGTKLKEIHVFATNFIDAIQLVYTDARGQTMTMPKIGGDGGNLNLFALEDDEYIIGVSGHSGWYVDNIRFHTNKRVSDVYGGHGGMREFHYTVPEGTEFAGFCGRSDWFIDAIGIVACGVSATPETRAPEAPPETKPAELELKKKAAKPAAKKKEEAKPAPQKKAAKPAAKPAAKKKEEAKPAPQKKAAKPAAKPAAKKKEEAKGRVPQPKELQKLEGIGPKLAEFLVANGILDLQDLSQTTVKKLKEILETAGPRLAFADPSSWPEQAALGAKGDWEGLKKLKKKLKK